MADEPFALTINDGPTILKPKDRIEFHRESGYLEFLRPNGRSKPISLGLLKNHIIDNASDLEQLGHILAAATGLSVSVLNLDLPSKTSWVTFKK